MKKSQLVWKCNFRASQASQQMKQLQRLWEISRVLECINGTVSKCEDSLDALETADVPNWKVSKRDNASWQQVGITSLSRCIRGRRKTDIAGTQTQGRCFPEHLSLLGKNWVTYSFQNYATENSTSQYRWCLLWVYSIWYVILLNMGIHFQFLNMCTNNTWNVQ